MPGCRDLSESEIRAVLKAIATGKYGAMWSALFMLGCQTGYRVSELLSLTWGQVTADDDVEDSLVLLSIKIDELRKAVQDERSIQI